MGPLEDEVDSMLKRFRKAPSLATRNARKLSRLVDSQGGRCAICGGAFVAGNRLLKATLDHMVPRSRGGPDALENLQATHWLCNGIKDRGSNADAETAILALSFVYRSISAAFPERPFKAVSRDPDAMARQWSKP
jgi:hypothetical protein